MSSRNLYRTTVYTAASVVKISHISSTGEIDLRAWFDDIVFGTGGKVPHGKWILIRHMRHNADGSKVACSCKNPDTDEGSPTCPYCQGESWLWDERWYKGYSGFVGPQGGLAGKDRFPPPGLVKVDYKVFYFRYDTPIRHGDKVIEVLLDEEGKIIQPFQRVAIYKPQTVADYRADNGRIEYFAVYCREEDALRPDVFTG